MRAWCRLLWLVAVCLPLACSPPSRDNDDRNNVPPVQTPPEGCGNGALDRGETCDSAIESGEGSCPTSCDDGLKCTADSMKGSARMCSALCNHTVVPGCTEGGPDDGPGPDCGNGRLDSGETCDRGISSGPGSCPTSCPKLDACMPQTLQGSASSCSAVCVPAPVTSCRGGDGCCPDGCTSSNDNDCPSAQACGNGRLDQGEACDPAIRSGAGVCPTSCNDGDSCTTDTLSGSASNCSARCTNTPIRICKSGDGCCPAGCSSGSDGDCGTSCTPRSCSQQGVSCGTVDNGCGQQITCGGCASGFLCQAGQCVQPTSAGKQCTTDSECGSGWGCITEAGSGFPGGYCTKACSSNGECGQGGSCSLQGSESLLCVKGCTSNSDCRWGYQCFDKTGDGVKECYPSGIGSTPVGGACSNTATCTGTTRADCITEAGNGFRGGYCTQTCSSSQTCPSGSHCAFGQGGEGLCVSDCSSSCSRGSGYGCRDADGDGRKECWPSATGAGLPGAPCQGLWDCGGGDSGVCASEEIGFPGGYCLIVCGAGGVATCPSGSTCTTINTTSGTQSLCFDACASPAECRSGYSCGNVSGSNVCWPQ